MDQTYLYSVHPRGVIKDISGVGNIRVAKSLYLTKEDVYKCLKRATVYRRFANIGINERVTIDNVDRVHRDEYISEEEWKKICSKSNNRGSVSVPVVEETTEPEEIVVEENIPNNDVKTENNNQEEEIEDHYEEDDRESVVDTLIENNMGNGDNESRQNDTNIDTVESAPEDYSISPDRDVVISDDDENIEVDSSNIN